MQVTALDQKFWQIVVAGEVVGYVDEIVVSGETRYRARRLQYPDARWIVIGEWWEFEAAIVACADVPQKQMKVRKITVPPQTRWF
ncbi:MAG: hypothetical protein IT191_04095 [Microbacteriaceae bacterium]|nr:hypothetical protein [Cryobacterium sp.]MBX3103641.1 hypothetical protein [Cryobacterium sp.]MCC6376181.1 hypothetical protein [Microbacteriaceae bacterium]